MKVKTLLAISGVLVLAVLFNHFMGDPLCLWSGTVYDSDFIGPLQVCDVRK